MKNVLLVGVMLITFMGCATSGMMNLGTEGLPDGSTVTSISTMSADPWGIEGKSLDRFQTSSVYDPNTRKFAPKSTFIRGDAGFKDGLGKQVVANTIPAVLGNTVQAGGMVWAAKVLRPDQTNVNAGNNSGNMSQGQQQQQQQQQKQKSTNINTNINDNTNINKPGGGGGPGGDKPGNGYGDNNHDHNGPPGQNK